METVRLKLEFPDDMIGVEESKNLLIPHTFFTIYPDYVKYGFSIVENLIDVVVCDNGYGI